MSERNLEFDKNAFEDLAWWIKEDRRKALRVIEIAKDIVRSPYEGIGKPEPLKHDLAGCWSRRIDQEHRIVYQVFPEKIRILACRFHY
jgi:toxin YoeB